MLGVRQLKNLYTEDGSEPSPGPNGEYDSFFETHQA
jgi:hypothetical protein